MTKNQSARDRVFIGISLLVAVLALFIYIRSPGMASTLLSSLAALILFLVLVALLSFILKKFYPVKDRGFDQICIAVKNLEPVTFKTFLWYTILGKILNLSLRKTP